MMQTTLARHPWYRTLCVLLLLLVGLNPELTDAKGRKPKVSKRERVPYKACVQLFQRAQTCYRTFRWYPYQQYKAHFKAKASLYKLRVAAFCLQRSRQLRLFWPGVRSCLRHKKCKAFVSCFEGAQVKLQKPEQFNSWVCRSGRAMSLYPNGNLLHCTTDAQHAQWIQKIPVMPNTYTLFHPNGAIWQTRILPHTFQLRNRFKVVCTTGSATFFPDGTLESCRVEKPTVYAGIACKKGMIGFHYNGSVATAYLNKPKTYFGIHFHTGTWLQWDRKGRVTGGNTVYSKKITHKGVTFHYEFKLHRNGQLALVTLVKPLQVGKRIFPSWSRLWFRQDGTLRKAVYTEKSGHLPHGEEWRDIRTLKLDSSGKITSSTLKHEQDVPFQRTKGKYTP